MARITLLASLRIGAAFAALAAAAPLYAASSAGWSCA